MVLEALITIVIFGMLVVAIFPSLNFLVVRSRRTKENSQASILLQEGMEATYNVLTQSPDPDLSGFADGQYNLAQSPASWVLNGPIFPTLPEVIDIYYRTITIEKVCRNDASGGQEPCSGDNEDPNSKKVTTVITWTENSSDKDIKAEMVVVKF